MTEPDSTPGKGDLTQPTLSLDISVPGRFWAFRIAREVSQRGGDVNIYTTEPSFCRSPRGFDGRVHTVIPPFLIKQMGYQTPLSIRLSRFTRYNQPFQRWSDYLFDRTVARRLSERCAGLFLGFAGACSHSVQRANELGYTTAVERSSTHIRTQRKLLSDEYERFGAPGQPVSLAHVEREEREYEEAQYVVTPSDFTSKTLQEHGVEPEKIIQIPFGTNTDFTPPERNGTGTFTLLFAGEVSLRKGIQYLLPAWDRLSLPDAELVIAGRISDTVAELVDQYEDDDSIRFVGWTDEMDALYRDASAFVLPSIEEGSARVTYEAMAWQLPVVTTPNSGWVGSDGEHGLEVPIRDVDSLADGIQSLYEDDFRRQKLGVNARELVVSEYTWDDYGDRVWEAYHEMVI